MRTTIVAALAVWIIAAGAMFTDRRFVPTGQSIDCSAQGEPATYCLNYCNSLTAAQIPPDCLRAGPPISWTITGAECAFEGMYLCACYCQITTGGGGA